MNSPTDLLAKRHQRIRVVATLVSVAALLLLVRSLPLDTLRTRIEGLLADLGPWGPIAFAGIYIIATVAMLPGSMFTLLGSAIFGFWTAYIAV
ncbi:MAG: hypothetical protein AB8G99_12405, partial [Planctomycetaceae bacterium]